MITYISRTGSLVAHCARIGVRLASAITLSLLIGLQTKPTHSSNNQERKQTVPTCKNRPCGPDTLFRTSSWEGARRACLYHQSRLNDIQHYCLSRSFPTHMHAVSGLFSCSMRFFAFAGCQLQPTAIHLCLLQVRSA